MKKTLKISSKDNVAIALEALSKGEHINVEKRVIEVLEDIPFKHKISLDSIPKGKLIYMYNIPVGRAKQEIKVGGLISTENTIHEAAPYKYTANNYHYYKPDITELKQKFFYGYTRKDGQVGTANYWIFVPLVFCQNRNMRILQEAFENELGYRKKNDYRFQLRRLMKGESDVGTSDNLGNKIPFFENIDGIKFLSHEGGCGGTREDAENLVKLLSGYIKNPNVAGATVLSLGCQHAQMDMLKKELGENFKVKDVLYFEQQQYSSEYEMLSDAINQTFFSLSEANQNSRMPVSIDKLNIGLECGGSDGLSGITANPLLGNIADKIVAVGGRAILAEFPELCGVEQDILDRCMSEKEADKFIRLMETYNKKAKEVGSGFDMNPSPGNIKDGLITDAIKSAGASTKGGRSMISGVLDYGEYVERKGLNLLCTPGNDVESTTGLVGSGANLILFTTGLGTPTGNPVCPVIKISSNSLLPDKMRDIIDFDAGQLLSQNCSMEDLSEELLGLIIQVASGKLGTKAALLNQDDFIPWKKGVSL